MEKFIVETKLQPVEFNPFAGPAIVRTAPSTEAQREVWVASQMGQEASCAYIESVSLELTGALDAALMEQSIRQLVERHEGLRSVISADGMRVIVQEQMEVPFTFTDLSSKSDAERKQALQAIADRDMTLPFDLLHGPLFRVQLIKTGADSHLLRLSGHHVIVDGWSLGIIMADVSRLYSALAEGRAAVLPEVFRFSDYAIAQIDFEKSPEHEPVEQYWMDLFKGGVPRMDLPTDRPRPRVKTYSGQRLDLTMDPALVRRLREVATRSGASFVTTLLTSFELLLFKLTEDNDLCVGLPAAGQSDYGMKDLVGHCVNLLALRSRIDEDMPFIDHLKSRRTAVLDAFDNQKYTFGTLVRKLNVPREPGRIPLCPVVFNIDMNMDDGVVFSGIKHRFISNPRAFEHFELFLNATGNEDGLILEWSYNTELFDERTVRGWMDQFAALIDRVCADPSATIGQLAGDAAPGTAGLPPAEWAGHAPSYPRDAGIGQLFDAIAAEHGSRTALVMGEEELSYQDLQQRVHALAAHLLQQGVKAGDPVGLCMDRSADMVTAMLAILRCGASFVPFDPSYPAERLAFMFEDTDVALLLAQRHLKDALPKHGARMLFADAFPRTVESAPAAVGQGGDAAYIMYTSGSTGKPKGVVVPHRAIVRLVREQNYLPFGPELCFLQLSNISFDASTLEIWGALLNGGKLVLQAQQKPTLVEIIETIKKHDVNTVWFTVGLFNLMVDEHVEHLRGLKHILTGGDVLSVPHVKKALRVLGPGVLINGYGPTENTTFTCCHAIDDADSIKGSVPIGRPINNTTVHILDPQGKPVAIGAKGELYAGGDGVALGYWKRDELNAERFVPDTFSGREGAKLYRTGDLVRWLPPGSSPGQAGTIEFIGRTDDQVKIRGFRIELGEIENALNDLAGVKDKVVVVRSDMPGEKQLVCYVVPTESAKAGDADAREAVSDVVREHLLSRLPEHMIPTAFVVLEAFPLTPNGKVDRKALPAPELRSARMRAQHVAPRDTTEKTLARIWSQVLGVQDLGVHDNFFDLGGHSIVGIQLLAQVERQLGRKLPLNALFQAPTVAQLATMLGKEEQPRELEYLAIMQDKGDLPPMFCVHGDEANYFLPKYLGEDQPFYAFFHQGEDGRPLPHAEVKDIAANFIRELKLVRPHGPYMLSGFSFGGLVAYEMAQQLTRNGDHVALLALLDTYAPIEFAKVMRQESKMYYPLKKFILRRAVKWIHEQGKALPMRIRRFSIIDSYDQATYRYHPEPYHGPILFIKAANSPGPMHMGWADLAKGGFSQVVSPGDHFNMIQEPHVQTLAKLMGEGIRKALVLSTAEAG
jgi:amino acid adenylation domain-containing protein